MFSRNVFIIFAIVLAPILSVSQKTDTRNDQENFRKSRSSYLEDMNLSNRVLNTVKDVDESTYLLDYKSIIDENIPKLENLERFSLDNYGIIDIPTLNEFVAPDPTLHKHYDFIIVGAGPAGCVLANRLSENPHWRVLLLEAGNPEMFLSNIPIFAGYLQQTSYNWGYKTERSENFCWGMEGQQCGFPRGKALGGTSVINYMIYNRGNRRDFDKWPEGWSYEEVLPYFLKSERANLIGLENSPYHNRNGPWSVEDPRYRTSIVEAFVNASIEAGHPQTDYNGESQIGVSYVQANTLLGRRHTAAKAYLEPIRKFRPNLDILLNARVTKVLIDHHTKIAYGVEYSHDFKLHKVYSRKEVILSAGTFNSPQLLMLSGIGPKNHLDAMGIPQICESPVGQRMYDHISHFGPTFIVNTTMESINVLKDNNLPSLRAYFRGQGPLTSIGGVEALTFLKTTNSDQDYDVPDVELIFVAGGLQSDNGDGLRRGMRITDEIYNTVYAPLFGTEVYSVMPLLFRPNSVGRLELRDNNPGSPPAIYPNFYDDEADIEKMLEAIKESIRISQMPAMQKLGARIHDIPLPNCAQYTFGTDDYWRCSLRTLSCTMHHQTGTCRMGPRSDIYAVVSPKLKVYGVKRLRVADTSVIPYSPTSHTNAASFMIGEKTSDMILQKWSSQTVHNSEWKKKKKYDFIIVGSGPAGCVLANRLSENPKWNILLLEIGNPENDFARVPIYATFLQSTEYNWNYTSVRQNNSCLGMIGEQCSMPRGKALGGTSVINYMINSRGNRNDFLKWPKGWSYDDVLPYFIKTENAHLNGLENSMYRGKNGLWNVAYSKYRTPLVDAFVKANEEAGYQQLDYNAAEQLGVGYVQTSTLNGQRHTAARAYLDPAKGRPNLTILMGARVTKVIINKNNKQATGVEYLYQNKKYTVKSYKEVILSAGVFNSPQILLLSGIGPKNQLKKHGIEQIHELPVGQTLLDHISHFGPTFLVNATQSSISAELVSTEEAQRAYERGEGPMTVIGGVEALTFMKTNNTDELPNVPDIEIIFLASSMHSDGGEGLRRGVHLKDEIYDAVYRPLIGRDAWTAVPMLFHPRSVGYVELNDANPESPPLINPNYLDDPIDVERILEGIKEGIRISKMPAMQKFDARIHDIPLPNCAHLTFGTDDYWRCSIRTLSCTIYHNVGTCLMGLRSNKRSVVSPTLQVHGIKNLRVADTSVIPEATSAHTAAASYMIGEKAADIIKNFWI